MSAPATWSVGTRVIWENGVEGPVAAVDFDDCQIMDHCGGWHDMDSVEIVQVSE